MTIPALLDHLHIANDAGEERAGQVRFPYAKRRRKQRFFRVLDSESGILVLRDQRDEMLAAVRAAHANIPPDEAYLASMCVGEVTDVSIGTWTDCLSDGGARYATGSARLTLNWREDIETTLYVFGDAHDGVVCCPYEAERRAIAERVDVLDRIDALISDINSFGSELVERLSPSLWLRATLETDLPNCDMATLLRVEQELGELRASIVPTQ